MMRRRVEEKRQNTVKEYKKLYKYTKNLNKEYQSRNLNALYVNEIWLSEKKKVKDRWKEYFQRKLSDRGQLNIELHMEEVDFNVTNKEISDPTYVDVSDIILKCTHQNAPAINGITTEILQKVGSVLWMKIHGLTL
jgi:hypothetical protein